MAEYEVKGVGKITLPDGLSEAEVQLALDSHPDVVKHLESERNKNPDRLSPENHPFGHLAVDPARMLATTKTLARNIPIIGNYISEDPYEAQFKKEAPIQHKATEIAGAVLPAAGASSALQAPAALSRGLPWLAAQTAGSAAISGADKAAQEHSQGQELNTSDILKALAIGGGATVAGAGASKFISPNMGVTPPNKFVPSPPTGSSYEDVLARVRWNNPTNQNTQEQLAALVNAARGKAAQTAFEESAPHALTSHAVKAAGAALGHAAGVPGVLAHPLTWVHQNVLKNQVMNDPERAAIMQALLMGGAQNLNRLPDTQ